MINIRTEDLKRIFNRIIDKLERASIEQVSLDNDLYRFVPTDQWGDFQNDVIEVGSLYDDLESLLAMVNDSEIPCTFVDFDRTASILKSISQTLNPPD